MSTNSRVSPFIPSTRSLVIAGIGLGVLLLGGVFAVAYAFSFDPSERLEHIGFIFGWMTVPLAALLVQVSAWLEKRAVARAELGCGSVLLVILGMPVAAMGLAFGLENRASAPGAAVICFGPFLLFYSVVVLVALTKAPQELRAATQARREGQMLNLIALRGGRVRYGEVATGLNIPEQGVDQLLSDLVEAERLAGVRYPSHGRFFTAAAWVGEQKRLLGVVHSRGQMLLDDLALELDTPRGLVEELIHALARRNKFSGYINWDEGMIYSAEAASLGDTPQCAHCGGELGLAGKGVIRCASCGTELFLPVV